MIPRGGRGLCFLVYVRRGRGSIWPAQGKTPTKNTSERKNKETKLCIPLLDKYICTHTHTHTHTHMHTHTNTHMHTHKHTYTHKHTHTHTHTHTHIYIYIYIRTRTQRRSWRRWSRQAQNLHHQQPTHTRWWCVDNCCGFAQNKKKPTQFLSPQTHPRTHIFIVRKIHQNERGPTLLRRIQKLSATTRKINDTATPTLD